MSLRSIPATPSTLKKTALIITGHGGDYLYFPPLGIEGGKFRRRRYRRIKDGGDESIDFPFVLSNSGIRKSTIAGIVVTLRAGGYVFLKQRYPENFDKSLEEAKQK